MVVDRTGSVAPTYARTGVPALVVDAGKVRGTFRVDCALMLTLHIGITLEARVTGAGGCSISLPALSIDATGTWSAGVNNFGSWCCGGRSVARCEGISNKTLITDANRNMVSNIAIGIDSTETRTRILTLSVDTRFVNWAILVYDTLRSTVWW